MFTAGVQFQDLPYRDMEKLRQVGSPRPPAAGAGAAGGLIGSMSAQGGSLRRRSAFSEQPPALFWGPVCRLCLQVRRDLIKAVPLMLISLPPFANYLVFVLM